MISNNDKDLDSVKLSFMGDRIPIRYVTDPEAKPIDSKEIIRRCSDINVFYEEGFVHVRAVLEESGVVLESFNSAIVQTVHVMTLERKCENCRRPGCKGEPVERMRDSCGRHQGR